MTNVALMMTVMASREAYAYIADIGGRTPMTVEEFVTRN